MSRAAVITCNIGYQHIGIFYKPLVAFCYGRLVMHFIKLSWVFHIIIVIFIRFYFRNGIWYYKY